MIYAFSEDQKKEIEKSGMMVIEVKRYLIKKEAAKKAWKILTETVRKIHDGMMLLAEKIGEVFDKAKFVIEEFCNKYGHQTSHRYQVVKLLSKCTGIEKLRIWNMTRHTFLARSCC